MSVLNHEPTPNERPDTAATLNAEPAQASSATPAPTREPSLDLHCPKCATLLREEQLVCLRCGTLLFDPKLSTALTRIEPQLLLLRRRRRGGTGMLSPSRIIRLRIRGLTEKLVFEEGTEIVLGRIDITHPDPSRFDLTPFGGHERGVSREHALLQLRNGQLRVSDLRSANGSFVNLRRLEPNRAYSLKDGDELTLGNLTIVVNFEYTPAPT
jgi:hypothetical protein